MKQSLFIIILSFFISLTVSGQDKNVMQFEEIKRPYKTISPQISNLLKIDSNALITEVNNIWSLATKATANLVLNNFDAAKETIDQIIELSPTQNQLESIKKGINDICTKMEIDEKEKKNILIRIGH